MAGVMEARIGLAGGRIGGGVGKRVSIRTPLPLPDLLLDLDFKSPSEVEECDTAIDVSADARVVAGLMGEPPAAGSESGVVGAELDSLNQESRFEAVGVADCGGGVGGFAERTRTVLAPVQASLRALKQASPVFHSISSRTALRRFALRSSSLACSAAPTESGLENR